MQINLIDNLQEKIFTDYIDVIETPDIVQLTFCQFKLTENEDEIDTYAVIKVVMTQECMKKFMEVMKNETRTLDACSKVQ